MFYRPQGRLAGELVQVPGGPGVDRAQRCTGVNFQRDMVDLVLRFPLHLPQKCETIFYVLENIQCQRNVTDQAISERVVQEEATAFIDELLADLMRLGTYVVTRQFNMGRKHLL
jgi:hypothetical protein